MPERKGIQIPVWCSAICRNAFNEKCVEECSVRRDCSYFEESPQLKLEDMRRFPKKEELTTPEEKFTAVTVYLAKVVDHLQGKEDEQQSFPIYHSSQNVTPEIKRAILEAANFIQSPKDTSKEKE